MKLYAIDVETTGLDPNVNQIRSIAVAEVEVDASGARIGQASVNAVIDVEPRTWADVEPQTWADVAARAPYMTQAEYEHGLECAARVAVIDDDAPRAPLRKALAIITSMATGDGPHVLMGYNVAFDAAFLRMAYREWGMRYPFDYHTFDLFTVAASRAHLGSLSLSKPSGALDTFDVRVDGKPHSAWADMAACVYLLNEMIGLGYVNDLCINAAGGDW